MGADLGVGVVGSWVPKLWGLPNYQVVSEMNWIVGYPIGVREFENWLVSKNTTPIAWSHKFFLDKIQEAAIDGYYYYFLKKQVSHFSMYSDLVNNCIVIMVLWMPNFDYYATKEILMGNVSDSPVIIVVVRWSSISSEAMHLEEAY